MGGLAHPEFGSSVNPITTNKGVDYAHHITASPPGFENPAAALQSNMHSKLISAQTSQEGIECTQTNMCN